MVRPLDECEKKCGKHHKNDDFLRKKDILGNFIDDALYKLRRNSIMEVEMRNKFTKVISSNKSSKNTSRFLLNLNINRI